MPMTAISTMPRMISRNDLTSCFFLWKDSGSMSQSATYMKVPAAKARGIPDTLSTSIPENRRKNSIPATGVISENPSRYLMLVPRSMLDSSMVDESEKRTTNLWMHIPMVAISPTSSPARNVAARARPSHAAWTDSPMNDESDVIL